MNPFADSFKDSRGNEIRRGRPIGSGGEGAVFEVAGQSDMAMKLYWPDKAAGRDDKVRAMVASAWSRSNAAVAYPVDLLHASGGKFAGFTMRRIAGHKPVHLLYSPGSRKVEFPQADFRFLIRTAANAARAVGSVHDAGCVIGDVNQSGFLVSDHATVALIDSDSFQVAAGGQNFLCRVSTPEYTPPELQNANFEQVRRTPNHDNFGLAVLIFQLLFLGRHPFSGCVSGPDDMPISQAIAEHLFAYSPNAKRISAPSNALQPSELPDHIGHAFETAFGPTGVVSRPTPAQWIKMLGDLEKQITRCSSNPAHHHVRGRACGWCRIERAAPGFVAFVCKPDRLAVPLKA